MFKQICLTTFILCLFHNMALAQAINPFMVSPDNEDWTRAWRKSLGCHLVSNQAFTGKTSLQQRLPERFKKGHYQWTATVPVIAGATYRFNCMVKYQDVKMALVQFHFVYPDGTMMPFKDFRFNSQILKGTQSQWTSLVFEVQAPAGSAKVKMGLRLNSSGIIHWDNPQMHMTKPATNTRFNQDQQGYNLQNSVAVVRLYDAQKIKDLNVTAVRYNALWSQIEPKAKGKWDENYIQGIVDNCRKAKDAGIDVMLSLGYPPRWASRQSKGVRGGNLVAKNHKDWQDFIRKIVPLTMSYVDSYRIMNEVDHQWDRGSQPGEYTRFLQSGYVAIKSVAPEKPVVMAGLSGTPGGFLQTMYDAGARDAMDIAACQPYVHGLKSPEAGHLADRLRAYRMVMTANGDHHPLWATEFGYPSEPVCSINPMQQAAYAVRSHLIALSAQAGVTRFFFYLLKDGGGDDCSQTGGMYDRDWNIKPIGIAVKTLAKVINPVTTYLGSVAVSDDPQLHTTLFVRADGIHVLALWNPEPGKQTDVDFTLSQQATVMHWDGHVQSPATQIHLQVKQMPVYLVGRLDALAKIATKPTDIGYDVFETLAKQNTPVKWIEHEPTNDDWGQVVKMPLMGKRNAEHPVMGQAQILGTSKGLAVRVDIKDSSPAENIKTTHAGLWTQDCVELFINLDPEQSPAGFVTTQCHQFIATPGSLSNTKIKPRLYYTANGSTGINQQLVDVPVHVKLHDDHSGYVLDFVLPWKVLNINAKPGDTFGFDVCVTVSDKQYKRIDTGVWFGDVGNSTDASLWGKVQLIQE